MTCRLFTWDEDVIVQVDDSKRVPEERREEVARAAAAIAERELSGAFLEAYWAEVGRLIDQACDELGVEPAPDWPDWVDPADFGEYVRDAGGGALVALYTSRSDGEARLDVVRLDAEGLERQLGRVRSGECSGMSDDLPGHFDKELGYGTKDQPAMLAGFREALADVLAWQRGEAWLASRMQ